MLPRIDGKIRAQMWSTRASALLAPLILIACDEVPGAECPSGQRDVGGICRLSCTRDTQCLLSEVCSDGACLPQPDPQTPLIKLFAAEPDVVPAGGSTSIDYVVLFADSVEMTADDSRSVLPGTSELAGTVTLSSIPTAVTVRLTARRGNGTTAMQDLTIQVMDPDAPVIEYFNANPTLVEPGGSTELEWRVMKAETVRITGGQEPLEGLSLEGSVSTSVEQTTDFVLEAENANGKKTTARVLVEVIEVVPPAIQAFVAIPDTVPFDIPAVVFWQTDRAPEVQLLDQNDQEILRSTTIPEAAAGAWMFWSPVGRQQFTLVAQNSAGFVEQSALITRFNQPADATIQLIEASPLIAELNAELRVTWQAAPQNVQVDLFVDGVAMSAGANGGYVETLFDEETPREVQVVASEPGGAIAEARHIVYGRTQDVPSTQVSPQPLNRQAVFGTLTIDGSIPGDWFAVFVPSGGWLDVGFPLCGPGMTAAIIDPATDVILDSGRADPNGGVCPSLSAPGLNTELLVHLSQEDVASAAQYVMLPQVRDPICGDGNIDGFEQCDDGNRRPIDGCDGFCRLEPSHYYRVEQILDPPAPAPVDAVKVRNWRSRTFEPADDEGILVLPIPFPFEFFGRRYHGLVLHTNGFVNLLPDFEDGAFDSYSPLAGGTPNAVISLYGTDLIAPLGSAETFVWYDQASGAYSIELRNFEAKQSRGSPISGRITLFADGRIRLDFASPGAAGPFQAGIEGREGHPVFSYPGCESGCSGDVLGDLNAIELIPGGL